MATYPLITANNDQFPAVWHTGPVDTDGNVLPLNPISDPYWLNTILLMDAKRYLTTDSSFYQSTLNVDAAGGLAEIRYDITEFPDGCYDLSAGRIANLSGPDYQAELQASEFTLELWCMLTNLTPNINQVLLFFGAFGLSNISAGTATFHVGINSDSYGVSLAPGTITINEPFHLAFCRVNRSTPDIGPNLSSVDLYFNGVLQGSVTGLSDVLEIDFSAVTDRGLGYDLTNAAYVTDMRLTSVNRYRALSSFTPPAPGTLPINDPPPPQYCEWARKGAAVVLSGSNLIATITAATDSVLGNIEANTFSLGDKYCEITVGGSASQDACLLGVARSNTNVSQFPGLDALSWSYYGANGNKYHNAANSAYGAAFGNGDVIRIRLNANGDLVFYKNGVSQGVAFSGLSGAFYPIYGSGTGGAGTRVGTLSALAWITV